VAVKRFLILVQGSDVITLFYLPRLMEQNKLECFYLVRLVFYERMPRSLPPWKNDGTKPYMLCQQGGIS